MSLNSNIISEMEGIVSDPFFSELVSHEYGGDDPENLRVIWDEPVSDDENFQSYLPMITLKSSDCGNIDQKTSRFTRDSKIYKCNRPPFAEQSGLTKIELTEVDS